MAISIILSLVVFPLEGFDTPKVHCRWVDCSGSRVKDLEMVPGGTDDKVLGISALLVECPNVAPVKVSLQ